MFVDLAQQLGTALGKQAGLPVLVCDCTLGDRDLTHLLQLASLDLRPTEA